jgi:alanine dehydrogenase
MVIGIPKEVKTDEFRVGATPFNVATLVQDGHRVLVEQDAGAGSGFGDADYAEAGAELLPGPAQIYAEAELIVKVKEPQPSEYDFLSEKHILFTYLHLAPLKELTSVLREKGMTAIGYETVSVDGTLPLLKPMSEVAGRMAPIVGAHYLGRYQGGEGVLIGGATGVLPAEVLVIGAGNAGFNAAKTAVGLGAEVTVVNRTTPKLESMQQLLPSAKTVLYSPLQLQALIYQADLVISTVLIPGARTPRLIDREMLRGMKPGSVFVDIAIDQGGTAESSRPTTHRDPTFVEEGVLHYCVANMPGAYPKTATTALTNATLPYIRLIAAEGVEKAISHDPGLALGVNVCKGEVTNKAVAEATGLAYVPLQTLLRESH